MNGDFLLEDVQYARRLMEQKLQLVQTAYYVDGVEKLPKGIVNIHQGLLCAVTTVPN